MQPPSPAPLPPSSAGSSPEQDVPRPPPGSGGLANNKGTLWALAGCGCLGVLFVAAVMIAMVLMRRSPSQDLRAPTGLNGAQMTPSTPQGAPAPTR